MLRPLARVVHQRPLRCGIHVDRSSCGGTLRARRHRAIVSTGSASASTSRAGSNLASLPPAGSRQAGYEPVELAYDLIEPVELRWSDQSMVICHGLLCVPISQRCFILERPDVLTRCSLEKRVQGQLARSSTSSCQSVRHPGLHPREYLATVPASRFLEPYVQRPFPPQAHWSHRDCSNCPHDPTEFHRICVITVVHPTPRRIKHRVLT